MPVYTLQLELRATSAGELEKIRAAAKAQGLGWITEPKTEEITDITICGMSSVRAVHAFYCDLVGVEVV